MSLATLDNGITRWAQVLAPARQLAEIVASTEFVPAALRGNPDACCAAIMYGDEIGITPMQALASIHMVDGRPFPSAELMRALILGAGHSITVHQADGSVCRVSGLRRGEDEANRVRVEWTLDMARSAGLLSRKNWQHYPRAMLLARATSELARIAFPDAIKGLSYIAEDEPEPLEQWAQQVTPAEQTDAPAARTVRRKRRTTATPEAPGGAASQALGGRPVTDIPLPESVPNGEPEPRTDGDPGRMIDPWAAPEDTPQQSPDPGPQVQPAPLSDSLRGSLMAATSRVGIDPTVDREMRLSLWSALLARPISTTRALSRPEALTLIRRLNDIETGAVEFDYDVTTGGTTLRHIYGGEPNSDHD